MSAYPEGFGINLIGAMSANMGLGVAARNFGTLLAKHDVPFIVGDLGFGWGGRQSLGELGGKAATGPADLKHPINLYVLALPAFETLFEKYPWLLYPLRMHVLLMYWEVSVLPPKWVSIFDRFDAVLGASDFVTQVAANGLQLTPVIEAGCPLDLPPETNPDRAAFKMPAEGTVFTASFDPNSDPARKNPIALIQAFRMAFPDRTENAHLAIRMNHVDTDWGWHSLGKLQEGAQGDPRIVFHVEPWEYAKVLAFFASADAYVSLHRAEGLGLGLMESMALGKPVIATGWSGNMDFMDQSCACLVRYRRTALEGNHPFYKPAFAGKDAFWVEPMVDDAASWMRKLHVDRPFRERIGAAGKSRVAKYQEEAWGRRWIDELAALYQAQKFLPVAPGKLSSLPVVKR
jgi:glycosyltransferase involved in cell wall biosynthesis